MVRPVALLEHPPDHRVEALADAFGGDVLRHEEARARVAAASGDQDFFELNNLGEWRGQSGFQVGGAKFDHIALADPPSSRHWPRSDYRSVSVRSIM